MPPGNYDSWRVCKSRNLFCYRLVFVGYTDLSSCDFELIGGVCAWNMNGGVVTRADDATPPLPTTDASGNSQGKKVIGSCVNQRFHFFECQISGLNKWLQMYQK